MGICESSKNQTTQNVPAKKQVPNQTQDNIPIPDENLFKFNPNFFQNLDKYDTIQKISIENKIYEGQMKDGKRNGKGRIYNMSDPFGDDVYEGEWKDDLEHGKGIYKYDKDFIYNGDWVNGKMEGKGFLKVSKSYYEGDFKNDTIEGRGRAIYIKENNKKEVYEGEFKDGKRHGKGIYKYSDGRIYNGEWKFGEEDG